MLPDRFWSKVRQVGDCWVWSNALYRNGYGSFWWEGQMRRAHILSYTHLVGEIPTGLELDHLCRNRACVNPEHLDPVTRSVNTKRGTMGQPRKTCPQGHAYIGANVLINSRGDRECRTCRRPTFAKEMERVASA